MLSILQNRPRLRIAANFTLSAVAGAIILIAFSETARRLIHVASAQNDATISSSPQITPQISIPGSGVSISGDVVSVPGNQNNITINHQQTAKPADIMQFQTLNELANALSGGELKLRDLFDFSNIVQINIGIIRDRYIAWTKTKSTAFNMLPYLANGNTMVLNPDIAGPHLTKDATRIEYKPDPHEFALMILTKKYSDSLQVFRNVEESPLLPDSVRIAIKLFNDNVERNVTIMQETFNSELRRSPDEFVHADDDASPYFGVVRNRYMNNFEQLKPRATEVLSAIRTAMGIK